MGRRRPTPTIAKPKRWRAHREYTELAPATTTPRVLRGLGPMPIEGSKVGSAGLGWRDVSNDGGPYIRFVVLYSIHKLRSAITAFTRGRDAEKGLQCEEKDTFPAPNPLAAGRLNRKPLGWGRKKLPGESKSSTDFVGGCCLARAEPPEAYSTY